MAKLNWTPWMGIADVKEELDRAVAEAARGGRRPGGMSGAAYFWTPTADVLETAGAFVITVDLPGVDREDVAVEVKVRTLWVYGERRLEKPCEADAVFHSLERSHGPFARRFNLPKGVDRGAVSAVFKRGVLEITLPKECEVSHCRRILIL